MVSAKDPKGGCNTVTFCKKFENILKSITIKLEISHFGTFWPKKLRNFFLEKVGLGPFLS